MLDTICEVNGRVVLEGEAVVMPTSSLRVRQSTASQRVEM